MESKLEQKFDYLFKVVMLGDAYVGKTAFMNRFCDDVFVESYSSTIGVDFRIKTIKVNEAMVKIQIWDTAGQERYQSIAASQYKGSQGCLLLYDVTQQSTLKTTVKYLKTLQEYCNIPDECVFLIGNKIDLGQQRQVTFEQANALACEMNISYMETSAKSGDNVSSVFIALCQNILKNKNILQFEQQTTEKPKKLSYFNQPGEDNIYTFCNCFS